MNEDNLKVALNKAMDIVEASGVSELYKPAAFNAAFDSIWQSTTQAKRRIAEKSRGATAAGRTKSARKGSGLAEAIKTLSSDGFFADYKTPAAVERELRRRAINYKRSVISMALFRLTGPQENKLFDRDGAGTAKDPWRYKRK